MGRKKSELTKTVEEKPKAIIKETKGEFVESDSNKKLIIIHFDKIFQRKLEQYNNIEITKGSYRKVINFITEEIRYFIEEKNCIDYAYATLQILFELRKENCKIEDVLELITNRIIKNEEIIKLAKEKVEENYTINIDVSDYKNEKLQLTDDMNKTYLAISMVMRLLVPIIQCVGDRFEYDKDERENLTMKIHSDLMVSMNNGDDMILEKIYNIVSSRIASTRYSNIVIWDYLEKINKDINLAIYKDYKYLILNNFVKLENNKSIISYIDVVIRSRLTYMFYTNYKYSYKNIDYGTAENSSDDLTDMEKLESSILRKDRGTNIINELSVKQEVDKIKEELLIGSLDSDEFEYFISVYKFNKFTSEYLEMFYKKKFNVIYKQEYIPYLVFNMISVLEKKKFKILPKILVSEIVAVTMSNKRKIIDKIRTSTKYGIIRRKYDSIGIIMDNKERSCNFVDNMIFEVKSKKFLDPETHEEINLDIDIVSEEIMDFIILC